MEKPINLLTAECRICSAIESRSGEDQACLEKDGWFELDEVTRKDDKIGYFGICPECALPPDAA